MLYSLAPGKVALDTDFLFSGLLQVERRGMMGNIIGPPFFVSPETIQKPPSK